MIPGINGTDTALHCAESSNTGTVILGICIHDSTWQAASESTSGRTCREAWGLTELGEKGLKHKPHKSLRWCIGMFIFVTFSIMNFGAFMLASASILVPLESVRCIQRDFTEM